MSQPTPYTRQADFSDWSAAYPKKPHSGTNLDAEFDAVKQTLSAVLSNLILIQRDDGALANNLIGFDQLNTAVLTMLEAAAGWAPRGNWTTNTAYELGDLVTQSAGTFVSAAKHSSDIFETELADGKWVKLYDSAGSIPADASVTTGKLADGAVTGDKLNITALDLSGTLRGQGGVAAGTAALGELLAAKRATGAVFIKSQRTTASQGAVGYRIEGVSATWDVRIDADKAALEFFDGTAVRLSIAGKLADAAGVVRSTDSSVPASGAGAFMRYAANVGEFGAYNWGSSSWMPATFQGSTVKVFCNGTLVLDASQSAADLNAFTTVGGFRVGYRGLPHVFENASRTLTPADNGKCLYSKNSGAQAISVDTFANQAIPYGADAGFVVITNRGTNAITLTALPGVTMKWVGSASTGNRTLAANGEATLTFPELNVVEVRGTLLS